MWRALQSVGVNNEWRDHVGITMGFGKERIEPGSAQGRRSSVLFAIWVATVSWLILLRVEIFSQEAVNLALPSATFQMVVYPLAQERGFMREEGIDLKIIMVRPVTSIQAMIAGDIHFTMAGTSVLAAVTRGVEAKVIAALNDQVLQWVLSKPEIATPQALKGKRIAVSGLTSAATFMTKQILSKYGLDPGRDVTYLDIGMENSRLAALQVGSVDAAILGVGVRYLARDAGFRELIYLGKEVKNSWGTLATSDRLIKERPKLVAGFVKATVKGLRVLLHDREAGIGGMVKFSRLERAVATRIYNDLKGAFTQDGVVDEETQKNDLAIILQVAGVAGPIPITRAYDFSFAREADRQLNHTGWRP